MRYVIIDYMHLVHRCLNNTPLSTNIILNGLPTTVDTTIPNYTIKNIVRYSGKGAYFTAVCLEGGNNFRKDYFRGLDKQGMTAKEYKGTRSGFSTVVSDGVNLAINCLLQGQTSCYRAVGYEADDMIASLVAKIKTVDTKTPIDIITNDSDMLPLVDEQVSVYKRGSRQYAEPGCPEYRLYYQVTPRSFESFLQTTSEYGKFYLPYNSILLYKLIRGDNSDNVPTAVSGYGAVKMSKLVHQMEADGVDFPSVFRYNVNFDEVIQPVLANYFTQDQIDKMKFIYKGINLRVIDVDPMRQLSIGHLQRALLPLSINIT